MPVYAGDSPAPSLPSPTIVGTARDSTHPAGQSPRLIAIAGPSCSGKTELARRLRTLLKMYRPVLFPLDGYYRDLAHLSAQDVARHNFDSPDSLDVLLLKTHLRALARGEAVDRPRYDYATHHRTGSKRTEPGGLLLAEGLFALFWEELLPLFALTIYVDLDDTACLERRLTRDLRERGASAKFTRWQWETHVKPMAETHIRPTRARAALVLDGAAPPEAIAARAMSRIRALLPPPQDS